MSGPHHTRCSLDSSQAPSAFSDRLGPLGQSSSEHSLYSESGPIADRSEHPFRASSMSHAQDIKRGTVRWRQQLAAARVMGGRAMKRTHSVCGSIMLSCLSNLKLVMYRHDTGFDNTTHPKHALPQYPPTLRWSQNKTTTKCMHGKLQCAQIQACTLKVAHSHAQASF